MMANLLYRTRLKIAAGMLDFRDYSLFADCFGPRWNYYLRDVIASIPIPLRFEKNDFETGVAAKRLALYAEDLLPFLDSEQKKKMAAAQRILWLKFEEVAFDASDGMHWQKLEPREADNIDVGPVTEADLHNDFFQAGNEPF
jgi:hypothetical protein